MSSPSSCTPSWPYTCTPTAQKRATTPKPAKLLATNVIPSSGTGTFDLGNLHDQLYLAKMGLGEAYVVKRKARTKTIARVKKAIIGSVEGAMTG